MYFYFGVMCLWPLCAHPPYIHVCSYLILTCGLLLWLEVSGHSLLVDFVLFEFSHTFFNHTRFSECGPWGPAGTCIYIIYLGSLYSFWHPMAQISLCAGLVLVWFSFASVQLLTLQYSCSSSLLVHAHAGLAFIGFCLLLFSCWCPHRVSIWRSILSCSFIHLIYCTHM